MPAEGGVEFVGCKAGLDGGGIYTSAGITFGAPGQRARTAIASNAAGGSGGGVLAFSSTAVLRVESGHSVVLEGNRASIDGGGLAFEEGGSLLLAPEGCPSTCLPSKIGDGVCDASCLQRACNWWKAHPATQRLVVPVHSKLLIQATNMNAIRLRP